MSDSELDCLTDEEVSENHEKLIEAVRQLDQGQRVKKPERSEPSLEVSEFHLVKSGIANQDAIQIEDLAKTLGRKGQFKDISKKLNAAKVKSKVLPKPLEKPVADRIKRSVGFENAKTELKKWTGIIARNRTAASVSFPLSHTSMKLVPTSGYLNRFRLKSELEKKLEEVDPPKEPEEEKDEYPLTLQEMMERRKEAAKLRAQQSYKVAKAIRQNKIKSKKFHRIQRKEKIKKTLKEFEELKKTDPQAALQKLEELDKQRAQERMTLRHKSTGQWAKNKQVRAKYDKESRQELAQQLSIGRDLTQKVKKVDSDEDDTEEQQPLDLANIDKENPWLNPIKTQSEVEEFVGRYRKYYAEQKNKNNENKSNEDQIVDKNIQILEENVVRENVKLSKEKNPVEMVIEEELPKQNGFSEHNDSKESDSQDSISVKNLKQKKDLQKASKRKRNTKSNKSTVSKVEETPVKAGTSNWLISPVDSTSDKTSNTVKNINIDEIFDSVEDKIEEEISKKLTKVKRMLEQETKKEIRKRIKKKNDDTVSDIDKLALKGQRNVNPIIDKPLEETSDFQPSNTNSEVEKVTKPSDLNNQEKISTRQPEIDPNVFMQIRPMRVKTVLPNELGGEEDAMDDSEAEEQYKLISEAFADDDVVDDFRKEKEKEIQKDQPEDIDLSLPGWGSWGGKNIKPSTRKKRRFILKMPKAPPRRDENKGDVVIIEEQCPKIKKHLVSELPFPFTTVKDFEASIRAPLSREFIPEKTFSKLTQPALKTKMGKVIEPMSEDALVSAKSMARMKKKLLKEEKKLGEQKNQNRTIKPKQAKDANPPKVRKHIRKKVPSNGDERPRKNNERAGAKNNLKKSKQQKTTTKAA